MVVRRRPLADHDFSLPCLQPMLVLSVVLLLPAGIRELQLACPCAGPLLAAVLRFTRLEALHITGNGGEVLRQDAAAPAVLPALRSLCLDYRQVQQPKWAVAGGS